MRYSHVKNSLIRIFLALVIQYKLKLDHLDMKNAFLHDDLDEEIFMPQPKRFKTERKENMVCKLEKSFYALKQSLRQWYKGFDSFMRNKRYTQATGWRLKAHLEGG